MYPRREQHNPWCRANSERYWWGVESKSRQVASLADASPSRHLTVHRASGLSGCKPLSPQPKAENPSEELGRGPGSKQRQNAPRSNQRSLSAISNQNLTRIFEVSKSISQNTQFRCQLHGQNIFTGLLTIPKALQHMRRVPIFSLTNTFWAWVLLFRKHCSVHKQIHAGTTLLVSL